MARLVLLLLLACIAPLPNAASAQVARLELRLAAGELLVRAGSATLKVALPADFAPRHQAWREALAAGQHPAEAETRALGRMLLGPAAGLLSSSRDWEAWPLELAPLSALVAPWEASGEALLEQVRVCYRPPHSPAPPLEAAGETGRGVLVIAPFHPGLEPITDAPDTLLEALRSSARRVDLIPRNDSTVGTLQGVLSEQSYGLAWLRARPSAASGLLGGLSRGASLVWWTVPASSGGSTEWTVLPAQEATPPTLLLDLWPRSEQRAAAAAGPLLDALRDGKSAADALREARRQLRAAPQSSPRDWAGWVLVGDPEAKAELPKPSWWQRLFGRR